MKLHQDLQMETPFVFKHVPEEVLEIPKELTQNDYKNEIEKFEIMSANPFGDRPLHFILCALSLCQHWPEERECVLQKAREALGIKSRYPGLLRELWGWLKKKI